MNKLLSENVPQFVNNSGLMSGVIIIHKATPKVNAIIKFDKKSCMFRSTLLDFRKHRTHQKPKQNAMLLNNSNDLFSKTFQQSTHHCYCLFNNLLNNIRYTAVVFVAAIYPHM